MYYKTVIWDFNGTLLSDMDISIKAMNTVLSRRSLPKINSLLEFQSVFGFPVEDYYKKLGLDFSKESFKVPADEWVELYTKDMFSSPLTDNAEDALIALKEAGIRQIVLSASEKQRLTDHLKSLGILSYFDEVYGTGDVYAKGKADIAKMLSEKGELFPAVLIGDTDHDKICADIIGCDAYLYSGGFMSEERLKRLNAPVESDLLKIAKEIIKKQ